MSGDHTGIGFFAFVAIVASLVAFWFGVLGLFFYGALNDNTGMLVSASILRDSGTRSASATRPP